MGINSCRSHRHGTGRPDHRGDARRGRRVSGPTWCSSLRFRSPCGLASSPGLPPALRRPRRSSMSEACSPSLRASGRLADFVGLLPFSFIVMVVFIGFAFTTTPLYLERRSSLSARRAADSWSRSSLSALARAPSCLRGCRSAFGTPRAPHWCLRMRRRLGLRRFAVAPSLLAVAPALVVLGFGIGLIFPVLRTSSPRLCPTRAGCCRRYVDLVDQARSSDRTDPRDLAPRRSRRSDRLPPGAAVRRAGACVAATAVRGPGANRRGPLPRSEASIVVLIPAFVRRRQAAASRAGEPAQVLSVWNRASSMATVHSGGGRPSPPRRRKLYEQRWIALLAVFVLVLAACNGDDDSGGRPTSATTTAGAATETTVAQVAAGSTARNGAEPWHPELRRERRRAWVRVHGCCR